MTDKPDNTTAEEDFSLNHFDQIDSMQPVQIQADPIHADSTQLETDI